MVLAFCSEQVGKDRVQKRSITVPLKLYKIPVPNGPKPKPNANKARIDAPAIERARLAINRALLVISVFLVGNTPLSPTRNCA